MTHIKVKITLFVLLFFISVSCKKDANDCSVDPKSLYFVYDNNVVFKGNTLEFGQSFTFHTLYGKASEIKVQSVKISCPNKITSFSREFKQSCLVVRTKLFNDNKFVNDTIQTGIVKGLLIDKNLWKLDICIPGLYFSGIISSKSSREGFRWELQEK